ncbi:MAG TPA: hypothetical protein VFV90_01295 [Usitatibacter sp.]|nr:hypothetical protein [Usitatibacter sp.]
MNEAETRAENMVAKFEYACLAEYANRFRCLPQFDDERKAPKFSTQ